MVSARFTSKASEVPVVLSTTIVNVTVSPASATEGATVLSTWTLGSRMRAAGAAAEPPNDVTTELARVPLFWLRAVLATTAV